MAIRIQNRRGTQSEWLSVNGGDGPVLANGEIGFETDTGKFKMGDGTNTWIDLPYFVNQEGLDTSLGDYVETALLSQPDGVATLDSNGKLAAAQIPSIDEITQDILDTSLIAGTGLDKDYNDSANTYTLNIDSTVATKSFTAGLLTNATKSNIIITGDENGLTISAENGVADSNTDNLSEGTTNKYFTDERAQDAVGNAVGTGLTYTDATGEIKVTPNTYDAYGSASAVAGDLSTHSSDSTNIHGITDTAELATKAFTASLLTGATKTNITITGDKDGLTITAENGVADSTTDNLTEGSTNKYFTDERAQDAIGNAVGTGISYNDSTGAISVDTTAIQARVVDVSDTEIGYLNGVTSGIQTQLNDKAPLASPTFTGTVTTGDLIINGDVTVNSGEFLASATSITIEDNIVQIAHNNPANTVDLGIVVGYNDGTAKHAGLVKDTSANTWKLFKGVTTEPATTVDFTQGSLDDLALAGLTASSITVGDVSNTEFGYLNGVTSAIQTQLDDKAPIASPTFTGTVSGITKSMVGLGNVENTALSTWAGTSSITTLGTVATGTWSADTIAINKGGTGATTAMAAATALLPSQTSNSGKYLTNDGAGTLSWATVSGYSAPTLGSTSIASGATVTTIADLTLSGATLTGSLTAGGSAGTSGYVLTSTGSGVEWAAAAGGGGADEQMVVMGAY